MNMTSCARRLEFSNPPLRFAVSPGFTLIEMAIVLVIIGLIVGGVLVGNDLIRAAAVRAQISQIEKYNVAVNTFIGKYNALPGDLNSQVATQFGFTPRGTNAGQGDGNGILMGVNGGGTGNGIWQGGAETGLFWVDLTTANGNNINMIDGSFSSATITAPAVTVTTATMSNYLPQAKIGKGNYVYVGAFNQDSVNWWGISAPSSISTIGQLFSAPSMSVLQAYSIDTKIDDGLPLTGTVVAKYLTSTGFTTTPNASPATATSCFDSTTASGAYAINVAGTASPCALSIRMQAGIGN